MAWSVKQHAAEIARKSTGEVQKAIAVHDFAPWTAELDSAGQFVVFCCSVQSVYIRFWILLSGEPNPLWLHRRLRRSDARGDGDVPAGPLQSQGPPE